MDSRNIEALKAERDALNTLLAQPSMSVAEHIAIRRNIDSIDSRIVSLDSIMPISSERWWQEFTRDVISGLTVGAATYATARIVKLGHERAMHATFVIYWIRFVLRVPDGLLRGDKRW